MNLDILFPNTIKTYKIFQPIIPIALSYIIDSGGLKTNKNNKQLKDAPSLFDKMH